MVVSLPLMKVGTIEVVVKTVVELLKRVEASPAKTALSGTLARTLKLDLNGEHP